jgi:hypothetical protein
MWKELSPLGRSVVDFEVAETICAALQFTLHLVQSSHSCGMRGSIRKRYFVYYICLCYGHKMCYVIIYYVLCI